YCTVLAHSKLRTLSNTIPREKETCAVGQAWQPPHICTHANIHFASFNSQIYLFLFSTTIHI
ncbi:MAG: hypothetical protein M3156_07930, partial [Thermoproteota archaeon]|nr:hypothetical protein [Thermoproteota archaeon]